MIKTTERPNRYHSKRVQTINTEPSKTQQQFKNDVNVNNIMKKYHATGQITHLNNRQGAYADISNAQDYFTSLTTIKQAGEAFDQLPSGIRKKFNNDPGELLEFIHNPNNFDECVEMGIFDPKQPKIQTQTHTQPTPPINDELNDDKTSITTSTKKTKTT